MEILSADDMDALGTDADEERCSTAVGTGWSEEFERRFAEVRDRLARVAASLVGQTEADDVVQDTYLIARRRLTQLRDHSAFEPWLFRISINVAYTRRRRERTATNALPRLAGTTSAPQSRDVALLELIDRLPSAERTLVVLHYGHGYRLIEIGRLIGLSEGAVKAKLFRARRRLLRQLMEASDD